MKIRAILPSLLSVLLLSMSMTSYGQGKLQRANEAYDKLAYTPAIELYQDLLSKEDNFEAMWKLSDCYRLTNQYDEAEYWYSKVVQYSEAEPVHLLYYAQVLQINEKYGEAVKWYSQYREFVPSDSRADNEMKASKGYRQFYEDASRYTLEHMPFNSSVYDFAPNYYKEGVIFSSSRDSAQSLSRVHTWIGEPFYDLYYVEQEGGEESDNWSKPKTIKGRVNTKYHEGPMTFLEGGSKVLFTRNNYDNRGVFGKVGKSSDKIVKLKIYSADIEGEKWTNIGEFKYNNDEYSVGHPAVSADGSYLYFVSDMPGGYGGTDLYVCEAEGVGSWGVPMNLGPDINTEGDEMFPYVDKDNELYFASDGQGGLGGLDIFRVKGSGTSWGAVKNMGAPLNSSHDDFSLIFNEDKSGGFLTSDRPGGYGSDDIYSFTDEGITLEGIVVDAKTDEPICGADVLLMYEGDEIGSRKVECDGEFEFNVLPGREYRLEGCAEGYGCELKEASTVGVKPGGKVYVKIPLEQEEPLDLEVLVIDADTRNPIPTSSVLVQSLCSEDKQEGSSDISGKSYYEVEVDCDYNVGATATGYGPGSVDVTTRGASGTVKAIVPLPKLQTIVVDPRDPYVQPGERGGGILLHHIYYDFDQSYIRNEAEIDLSVVEEFMRLNGGTIVEIGSHTDARASYAYNIALSERRAKAAVDWLVQRGISRDRLVAVGYGETQTVNGCVDNVPCSEEEHQRNRRTEFRVIGNGIDQRSIERVDIIVDPCTDCPF